MVALLLERSRRPAWILVALTAGVVVATLPRADGLSIAGQRALAVFVTCMLLWVTNAIPMVITSLLALALLPLSGAMRARDAYSLFGNEAVFFILGVFILGAGLVASGLSTRIAVGALRRFGRSAGSLLDGVYLLSTFLAFVMSEHAVAAILFPIVMEMAKVLDLDVKKSGYARALLVSLAWGTSIGGIATFLGGGRAPLAAGILLEATGERLGFVRYALAAIPLSLVLFVIGRMVIRRAFPFEDIDVSKSRELVETRRRDLPKVGARELGMGGLLGVTIVLWVTLGEERGLSTIALAAVVLLFVLRIVKWSEVETHVRWGIFLMYGGAIALGASLDRTGAARWASESLLGDVAIPPVLLIAVLSGIALLLTEFMSNSAVVAAILPMALGIARARGIPTAPVAVVIAVSSGLALALPMGTPANAIVYSSGYFSIRQLALPGFVLAAIAWILLNLAVHFYWPIIGLGLEAPS